MKLKIKFLNEMFLEMQLLLFAKETVRANGFYQLSPYSVINIIFPIVRNTCGESMSLRSLYSLIAYFIHFKRCLISFQTLCLVHLVPDSSHQSQALKYNKFNNQSTSSSTKIPFALPALHFYSENQNTMLGGQISSLFDICF